MQRMTASQSDALPGLIGRAPGCALGFDTETVVSFRTAQAFAGQGYTFCLRYLSRGSVARLGDLTEEEAADILSGGLALMAVQRVAASAWLPTAALGSICGRNAANGARAIGFPAGVNLWVDLGGVDVNSTMQDVIEYCNCWYQAVFMAGYLPGLYVGDNCGLDAAALETLPFKYFWKSLSTAPLLRTGGYQIVQSPMDAPVNGIDVYVNQINPGRRLSPQWLGPENIQRANRHQLYAAGELLDFLVPERGVFQG